VILATHGDVDASNYLQLVSKAEQVYQSGVRNLLLDLTDTQFLSSSGLVALHSIALLMRGEKALDPEAGWGAIHAMGHNLADGVQKRDKLLNPQPRVDRTLDRAGLKQFFEIYMDRETALASFTAKSAESPTS
jgi:anti-anti-sigma regulatory factor